MTQATATMAYRKDQGRMARMAAFWTLIVLLFYGCTSLNGELTGRWPGSLGQPMLSGFQQVPVLGINLTASFLIASLLFTGGAFALYRWLERPKSADLLIETEQELRKVTWPSANEVVNSSMVVIICVLFLMGYLAASDWFLARVTRVLLFGG